jgi:hypothetical protein
MPSLSGAVLDIAKKTLMKLVLCASHEVAAVDGYAESGIILL